MRDGKGDSVKRYLAAALACASLALAIGSPSVARGDKPAPMRFEWRLEGPADQCGAQCRIWISATGVITEDTARAFEAFATVMTVAEQCVPGTINYREFDPEADLWVVPETTQLNVRYALSNNIGLGGHNGAVIFARYNGD
jgi:hypothetical protein